LAGVVLNHNYCQPCSFKILSNFWPITKKFLQQAECVRSTHWLYETWTRNLYKLTCTMHILTLVRLTREQRSDSKTPGRRAKWRVSRAAVGIGFQSPYPSHTHSNIPWESPRNPHTHRTQKSSILITHKNLSLFVRCILCAVYHV